MSKYIMGIESSCDDTGVAIIKDEKELLANVVSSQIDVHAKYGGVMPEIASRLHAENITICIEKALNDANLTFKDLSAVAVTSGPGLIGALHVGLQAAKTISLVHDIPLISVHHLAGHIYANNFEGEIKYPCLALIVSGGNSEIVYMENELKFKVIGQTIDDAIGECIDKVARIMGLPYPGGPHIDKMAKLGQDKYKLPIPKDDGSCNFSFSGLKTAVINLVHKMEQNGTEYDKNDLACSFQTIAFEQIFNKFIRALSMVDVKQVVLGGGVSANSYLRSEIVKRVHAFNPNIEVMVPSLWCCMDNAAMIALVGSRMYDLNKFTTLDIGANPDFDIEDFNND